MSFEDSRHRVAVAGRVIEPADGAPVPGARVWVTGDAGFAAWLALKALAHGAAWDRLAVRPDRTAADANGRYRFLDLPAGDYLVRAALAGSGGRRGTATVKVSVSQPTATPLGPGDAAPSRPPFSATDLVLPSTRISGTVRSGGAPVAMAEVRVMGSGEAAFTDAAGGYALWGVEPGARRLRALATGMEASYQAIAVPGPDLAATADFSMTAAGVPAATKAGG